MNIKIPLFRFNLLILYRIHRLSTVVKNYNELQTLKNIRVHNKSDSIEKKIILFVYSCLICRNLYMYNLCVCIFIIIYFVYGYLFTFMFNEKGIQIILSLI